MLVKNPAGFNQVIRILTAETEAASVLVAINDESADGRDVSWLWDARVEELASTPHRFGAGGVRSADMALRFKYAGVSAWSEPDFQRALDGMAEEEVNERWQREMRDLFEDPEGREADRQMQPLDEVFHLD